VVEKVKMSKWRRALQKTLIGFAIVWLLSTDALGNGQVHEVDYSIEATIRWIVVGFGGLIALTGAVLAGLNLKGLATVHVSALKQKASLKNINQGVVIVLAGVAVLIAALAFLPEKSRSRTITGKLITMGDGPLDPEKCEAAWTEEFHRISSHLERLASEGKKLPKLGDEDYNISDALIPSMPPPECGGPRGPVALH
jgi:hypothetical protein